jgi:hypothetical protein
MRRMAVEIEPANMDLGAALSICTSLDSSGKLPSAFAAGKASSMRRGIIIRHGRQKRPVVNIEGWGGLQYTITTLWSNFSLAFLVTW